MYKRLKNLFDKASNDFLENSRELIVSGVSERCLCVELRDYLKKKLRRTKYKNYYVDNEYNRNCGHVKTTINGKGKVINIQCDMLVHSRGEIEAQDNLIALEMKFSNRKKEQREKDKDRLCALTMDTHGGGIYAADGKTYPEQVCGYVLGVYYEINRNKERVLIEYYKEGVKEDSVVKNF